jgi:hypothetical protein
VGTEMKAFDDVVKEVLEVAKDMEQVEVAKLAEKAEKKDGFHRCFKCGEVMADLSYPYTDKRLWYCFTEGCNHEELKL